MTGNEKTNFADKRTLPSQRVNDTFFAYLAEEILEIAHRVWGSRRGVFGTAGLSADGADNFQITVAPVEFLDGDGNILVLSALAAAGIQLENAAGVTYYVGLRHCLIPSGVVRNPRMPGVMTYDTWVDSIGVSGVPTSVTQVGATLEIVVDSIFEVGVSHAGRSVMVWLNVPKSADTAVAIETCTVTWSGGQNLITTTALLGQGTVSTTVSDYAVVATGPTVRRNTDLSVTDPFAYVGTVQGAGAGVAPAVFSTVGQIDVSSGLNPTLDMAYDGGPSGAAGSGRVIYADAAAVEVQSTNDSGDARNAQFVLDRFGASGNAQISLLLQLGDEAALGILGLETAFDGVNLLEMETVTLAVGGDVATLTRGGVDLTAMYLDPAFHAVIVSGATPSSEDGIYSIASFTVNTITLTDASGASPTFTGGAASIRVVCPRYAMGNGAYSTDTTRWNSALILSGKDNDGNDTPLVLHPHGATSAILQVLNNRRLTVGNELDPRTAVDLVPDAVASGSPGMTLSVGKLIGTVGAEVGVHANCGLAFRTYVNGAGNADAHGLTIGPHNNASLLSVLKHSSRVASLLAYGDLEWARLTPLGRWARGARHEDDFPWLAEPTHLYLVNQFGSGAGAAHWNNATRLPGKHGGVVELQTGGTTSDAIELYGAPMMIARHGAEVEQRRAYLLSVRACMPTPPAGGAEFDVTHEIGLSFNGAFVTEIGIRYEAAAVASNWTAYARHLATTNVSGALLAGVEAPASTDEEWFTFEALIDIHNNIFYYWINGGTPGTVAIPDQASTDWDERFRLFARCEQFGAQARILCLDHWLIQELKVKGSTTEFPVE